MPLQPPTLSTSRLKLRDVTAGDADALFAQHSSKHVLRYWDSPPWHEHAQAERFITRSAEIARDELGVRLAVEHHADGHFIGWCCVAGWNHDFRRATLGYCFAEHAWGHGFATEAAAALLDWAFPAMDLNRVDSETDTRNSASVRVLEKLGFQHEGLRREDTIVDGGISNSFIFGLLRREWKSPFAKGN